MNIIRQQWSNLVRRDYNMLADYGPRQGCLVVLSWYKLKMCQWCVAINQNIDVIMRLVLVVRGGGLCFGGRLGGALAIIVYCWVDVIRCVNSCDQSKNRIKNNIFKISRNAHIKYKAIQMFICWIVGHKFGLLSWWEGVLALLALLDLGGQNVDFWGRVGSGVWLNFQFGWNGVGAFEWNCCGEVFVFKIRFVCACWVWWCKYV